MPNFLQRRIGWLVLWFLCLASVITHLYLAFYGHPQNRGLTPSHEILIVCDILTMATLGGFYRWGSIFFWPTVGALFGSMVAVSGSNAFDFTLSMMLLGFLVGLTIETVRSLSRSS